MRYSHHAERGHHLHTRCPPVANTVPSWPGPHGRRATTPVHASRDSSRPSEYVQGSYSHRRCTMPRSLPFCFCFCFHCFYYSRTRSPPKPSSSSSLSSSLEDSCLDRKKEREREENGSREERGERLLHPDRNLIARYLFPLPCTASEIS